MDNRYKQGLSFIPAVAGTSLLVSAIKGKQPTATMSAAQIKSDRVTVGVVGGLLLIGAAIGFFGGEEYASR